MFAGCSSVRKFKLPAAIEDWRFMKMAAFVFQQYWLSRNIAAIKSKHPAIMMQSRHTRTTIHHRDPASRDTSYQYNGTSAVKVEKEKTVMCENILRIGYCPHGKTCKFAHSDKELRTETYATANLWGLCHNAYRSRPCFTFVATGKWWVRVVHNYFLTLIYYIPC